MGNAENLNRNKIQEMHVFEDNKSDYFNHIRKQIINNIKEIECTLNVNRKNNFTVIEEINDPNLWKTFIIQKLEKFKTKTNENTVIYVDNVIKFIQKYEDTNYYKLVHRFKMFLSNQINQNKNKNKFLDLKEKEPLKLKNKCEILNQSLDYIFENLDHINHPINKVIQVMIFNFSLKYKEEIKISDNFKEECSFSFEIEEKDHLILEKIKQNIFRKYSHNEEIMINVEKKNSEFHLCSDHINTFYSYIKEEITYFIKIISMAIIKFYSILEESALIMIENIAEKVKDLLIQGDLLRLLQKLKYEAKKKVIYQYKQKFLQFHNILPKDLGLSPYFSMDYHFKTQFVELLKSSKKSKFNKVGYNDIPYSKCLIYLMDINRAESISKKLDVISNLRNLIIEEIDSFWVDIPLRQIKRCVDADNILSVFIYLIIKSQLSDLIVDMEIIDDFTNKTIKQSRKGYFFLLAHSSLEYLLNSLTTSRIEKNQLEYKSTLEKEYLLLNENPDNIMDMSMNF